MVQPSLYQAAHTQWTLPLGSALLIPGSTHSVDPSSWFSPPYTRQHTLSGPFLLVQPSLYQAAHTQRTLPLGSALLIPGSTHFSGPFLLVQPSLYQAAHTQWTLPLGSALLIPGRHTQRTLPLGSALLIPGSTYSADPSSWFSPPYTKQHTLSGPFLLVQPSLYLAAQHTLSGPFLLVQPSLYQAAHTQRTLPLGSALLIPGSTHSADPSSWFSPPYTRQHTLSGPFLLVHPSLYQAAHTQRTLPLGSALLILGSTHSADPSSWFSPPYTRQHTLSGPFLLVQPSLYQAAHTQRTLPLGSALLIPGSTHSADPSSWFSPPYTRQHTLSGPFLLVQPSLYQAAHTQRTLPLGSVLLIPGRHTQWTLPLGSVLLIPGRHTQWTLPLGSALLIPGRHTQRTLPLGSALLIPGSTHSADPSSWFSPPYTRQHILSGPFLLVQPSLYQAAHTQRTLPLGSALLILGSTAHTQRTLPLGSALLIPGSTHSADPSSWFSPPYTRQHTLSGPFLLVQPSLY